MPSLHDGRQVASDSDDWRLECLALYLLRTYTRTQVGEWLAEVEAKGGRKWAGLRDRLNAIQAARRKSRTP